jgi:hypothetical protein
MYSYILIIILIILIIYLNNTKKENFLINNESVQNIYGTYLNSLNKFNESDPNNNLIQYVDVCGNLNVNGKNSRLNSYSLNTNMLSLAGTDIRYYLRGCTISSMSGLLGNAPYYGSEINIDLHVGKYSTKYNNYFNAATEYLILYPGFGVHLYNETDLENNYSKAYNYSTEPLFFKIGINKLEIISKYNLYTHSPSNLYSFYPYRDKDWIVYNNKILKESILDYEIYPISSDTISSIEVILLDLDKWKKHII